jgi:hypothetical protein
MASAIARDSSGDHDDFLLVTKSRTQVRRVLKRQHIGSPGRLFPQQEHRLLVLRNESLDIIHASL